MESVKARIMLETEKEITAGLTEGERFRYFLGRMQYLRYASGKENLLKSDCSGSVCLALLLATGCAVRVTADTLSESSLRRTMTARLTAYARRSS